MWRNLIEGGGYAVKMVQEILSKLKNNQRLIAYAAENNVASIKTLTRVGFIKSDE